MSDKPSFIRELPRLAASTTDGDRGALPVRRSRRCWRSTGASRRSSPRCAGAHELDDTVLDVHLRQRVLLRRAPDPGAEDAPVRGGAPRPAPDPGSRSLSGRRAGGRRGLRASRQHRPRPDDPRSRRRRSVPRGAALQGDGRPLAARPDQGRRGVARGPRNRDRVRRRGAG